MCDNCRVHKHFGSSFIVNFPDDVIENLFLLVNALITEMVEVILPQLQSRQQEN